VNDAAPPEAGTNGTSASVFVGEYCAHQRGTPVASIVHLNIPPACCPTHVAEPETLVADGDENFVWLTAPEAESAHVRSAVGR